MKLHILGSNSLGNGYVLENDTEALLIEAGVSMRHVKKALKWQLNKLVGAIISHEHNDHAKFVKEVTASGVVVLALKEVFNTHGLIGKPFTKEIIPFSGYKVGGFKVQPLPVKHDVPCVGYIVQHDDMGKMLFITDTVTFDYIVPGLTAVLIEANYADDILNENIAREPKKAAQRYRLLNSHMEIGQTKQRLAEQDLSAVENIVLIHLSDDNSDEERFVAEVRDQTYKTVWAAVPGMVIDLSKEPY